MTQIADAGLRELAYREADGVAVALLWHTGSDALSVMVVDSRTDAAFELVLDRDDRPMDVFHHPYAYAAQRGLEVGAPSRLQDLVAA